MKKDKHWVDDDGTLYFGTIPKVTEKLPNGIYELNESRNGFYLKRISEDFAIEGKIYGTEEEFINRVITANKNIKKNFGILLKGLKGTGKTITAKLICQKVDVPVILVNQSFNNIGEFINSIEQDIVIFFDEFEKVYNLAHDGEDYYEDDKLIKRGIKELLTLMDGVFTSDYKRIFLMTTNKIWLPETLESRPSRIRYIKDFTDLSTENIKEVLDDLIENKELIPQLVTFLSSLQYITIDIIKTLAEEVNIFDRADDEFLEVFNVKKSENKEEFYLILSKGQEKLLLNDYKYRLNTLYEGMNLAFRNERFIIKSVNLETNELIVTRGTDKKEHTIIAKEASSIHSSMLNLIA